MLNVEQELEICQLGREKGFSHRRIAEEFGISRPTLHDIRKSEEKSKALQAQLESGDCTKKRCTVRNSDFPELDRAVFTRNAAKILTSNCIAQRCQF